MYTSIIAWNNEKHLEQTINVQVPALQNPSRKWNLQDKKYISMHLVHYEIQQELQFRN